MQKDKKLLPIGINRFEDLRLGPFYYIDKTVFIYEIIENGTKVDMIPRDSQSGKSLNLSMLRQFFSIGADPALFDGLEITQDKDFCALHQGQYPVLYLDLKELCTGDYATICRRVEQMLCAAAQSFSELATSPALDENHLLHTGSLF